ncbi:MAG TPA: tRNA glutamyl-Q(34) synthetase GluQRS [Casimicrobiaceae bacterium]|nr:tRNA glutamyl-Q(34) synthetase GluQRS [Casimicrobiaceae bacterium]
MPVDAPQRYRGRFAPSPTGPLHFGSLVAAMASYCDARSQRGDWLVRIEDVDEPRSRPDAESDIVATLARYGFRWDETIVRQSQRTAHYDEALASLRRGDRVYDCVCTRRELEAAPIGSGGERVYPGTCRHGVDNARRLMSAAGPPQGAHCTPLVDRAAAYEMANEAASVGAHNRAPAVRFRVDETLIEYADRLFGSQHQRLTNDVGDFVVKRADGLFAYQLAVVVDDALQRITDVVRGVDLIASTPRQIALQRALGFPQPRYLHLPIAVDARSRKLSKQTNAPPLPHDPLPALATAWRFLDQPMAIASPRTLDDFWSHATASWTPSRLPPVSMLPVPRA